MNATTAQSPTSRTAPELTPKFRDAVLALVAESYKPITREELLGARRTATVAEARQVAMYLLRSVLGFRVEEAAYALMRKHHGSAIHAVEFVEAKIKADGAFWGRITFLSSKARAIKR